MTKMYLDDVLLVGDRSEAVLGAPLIGIDKNGIDGWYSTPPIKNKAISRIGADGDWSRDVAYYSPRTVSVKMNIYGDGREEHVAIWNQLGQLNRTKRKIRLVDHGSDTFIYAFLEFDLPAGQSFKHSKGSFVATADDPVRYESLEQILTLSTSVSKGGLDYPIQYPIDYGYSTAAGQSYGVLVNSGNVNGYPVITVEGDLPDGFTLMDSTGKSIVYTGRVFPGTPVVVDCKARAVLVQGVNRSWELTRREWFTVSAGGSLGVSFITSSVITNSAATATIQFRSTYI